MMMERMVKKVLWTFCSLSFVVFLASCDRDKDDNGSFTPSAALEKAFEADFPSAKDVKWMSYGDYAVVSFNMGSKALMADNLAWYTNTSSPELLQRQEVMGGEEGMLPSSLPQAVKDAFVSTGYADPAKWRVDEVEIQDRYYVSGYSGSRRVYKIELDAVQPVLSDVDLYFDEQGVLLKECIDHDDDVDQDWDDYDIPLSPEMVKKYVSAAQDKYPGYKVDEIERLATPVLEYPDLVLVEMEREVAGEDEEIAVFLKLDATWLATCFEQDFVMLPQAVKDVLQTSYVGWEIEDSYRWESSDATYSTFYSVEMEKEEGSVEAERHVFFDETGKVMRTVSKYERD